MNHQLTTAEEAAFMKMLENILETAYNMQEEAEHMFIYQESVLNKSKRKALSVNFVGISEIDGNGSTSSLSRHPLLSVSSVDQVLMKKSSIFFESWHLDKKSAILLSADEIFSAFMEKEYLHW